MVLFFKCTSCEDLKENCAALKEKLAHSEAEAGGHFTVRLQYRDERDAAIKKLKETEKSLQSAQHTINALLKERALHLEKLSDYEALVEAYERDLKKLEEQVGQPQAETKKSTVAEPEVFKKMRKAVRAKFHPDTVEDPIAKFAREKVLQELEEIMHKIEAGLAKAG